MSRSQSIGTLINGTLVAVAACSWAAFSFPLYAEAITVATGVLTIVVCMLAFRISRSQDPEHDEGNSTAGTGHADECGDSGDGDASVLRRGDEVPAGLDILAAGVQKNHQDVYWKILDQLSKHRSHLTGLKDADKGTNFALTMSVVTLHIDQEKKGVSAADERREIFLRPELAGEINIGESEE